MSASVSPNLPPCPLLPPPEPTPPTPHFPCWACPFQGELTAEGPVSPEKPQPLPRGLRSRNQNPQVLFQNLGYSLGQE